jgi:predicted TPR repeat methyltransferase
MDSASTPPEELYNADYFQHSVKETLTGYMDYGLQEQALRMTFRRYIKRILPHLNSDAVSRMLDVGCAYGFLLDEARRVGLEVQGVDFSETAIEWMEKHLHIKGTVGQLSDAPRGPFQVISATDILEHVREPMLFLAEVDYRLSSGGLLMIVTGANDTASARLLGKRWWFWNPPDHCVVYSRKGLRQLLFRAGFGIVEHRIFPLLDWVGLNNGVLKLARMLERKWLGKLAARLPSVIIPVPHFTGQFLIARKT